MTDNIDYNVDKTLGIDVEKEDRSVGIFGNNFILVFECKTKQIQLNMFDDEFNDFLDIVEPFIKQRKNMKKYEEEFEKSMKEGN